MNIKNTKELLELGLVLVEASTKAQNDGKISFGDLALLIRIIPKIVPAINGIDQIPLELKDLDDEEIEEIKGLIVEMIGYSDLGNEKIVEIANELISSSANALKAIKGIIELKKG